MSQNYYLKKTVGIYKVTNNLSGLCYVGQAVDVCERWKGHTSSRESLLGQAIHSDGIRNFSFQVLEECRKEELNSRESFWIRHFDCIHPQGYNKNQAPKVAPIDELVNRLVAAGGSKKDVLAAKKMHLNSIWQSVSNPPPGSSRKGSRNTQKPPEPTPPSITTSDAALTSGGTGEGKVRKPRQPAKASPKR